MTQPAPEPDPAPATDEQRLVKDQPKQPFNEFLLSPPYLDIDLDIRRSKEPIRPFDFELEDGEIEHS